jgi:integrase
MGVKVREKPKGSGEWWIFINHRGKRMSKKAGKIEKRARDAAKQIEANLLLGDLGVLKGKEQVPTFGEYSEKYLAFIKMNRRHSTYERYYQALRDHIKPDFGKKPLDEINRGDVRDFILKKSEKFKPLIFRDIMSGVFNYAIDDEVINVNPVSGITKRLKMKRDKSEDVDPLNETDMDLFLNTCQEHFRTYYPFFFMAARTGMRLGELLAVRWGDLDFSHKMNIDGAIQERPFIWVKRSYRRAQFTKPKNGKTRKVDMSTELKTVLQEHKTREKKLTLKNGLGKLPELVFHRNGKVIEQNYIRRVFKRVLVKAELREIKLHGLRHSFASQLLSTGESPVYVKEMLGHSSIQITVDIYGKWIPTERSAGVNKLDKQFKARNNPHPMRTSKNRKAVT